MDKVGDLISQPLACVQYGSGLADILVAESYSIFSCPDTIKAPMVSGAESLVVHGDLVVSKQHRVGLRVRGKPQHNRWLTFYLQPISTI
jgi:hypothetical protein